MATQRVIRNHALRNKNNGQLTASDSPSRLLPPPPKRNHPALFASFHHIASKTGYTVMAKIVRACSLGELTESSPVVFGAVGVLAAGASAGFAAAGVAGALGVG